MFSVKEKNWLAAEFEKLVLSLNHPEMPRERPSFSIHVDGKESWSWADIKPNWHFEHAPPPVHQWNEIARDVLERGKANHEQQE